MKWTSTFLHPQKWQFQIALDNLAGYYLYIWDDKGNNTHDYLQSSFEMAREQAFEDFGVPLESWVDAG